MIFLLNEMTWDPQLPDLPMSQEPWRRLFLPLFLFSWLLSPSLSLSFILVSLSLTLSLSLCFSWFLSLSLSQYLFSFFAWLIFLLKIIQANFTKSLWDICGRSCCIKIRQYAGTYKSILADFLTVQLIPVFALFK